MSQGAALVTGSARRVGRAIALKLAENGFDIALHYHYSQIDAHKTAQEVQALGVKCQLFQANLEDASQCETLAQSVFSAFPQWNVLINSAAIFERGSLVESSKELLARHMRINFEAPVLLTRDFARLAKQGAVVNLIDARVMQVRHSHVCYLLSKKALYDFTQMSALELAPDVRVNGVCPGFVLASGTHEEGYGERLRLRLPTQTLPTVEELTQAVLELVVSPGQTGQFVYVDGGEHTL
jgi:NAD(P)-dependent dehydrogenase (short-subunit alcohol dehydrogenase family)